MFFYRHEPPVLHEEIEFLQNDDDMVVINKPASIPVCFYSILITRANYIYLLQSFTFVKSQKEGALP